MLIRPVKDFIEIKILSYTFKFKRLTWEDYMSLAKDQEDFRRSILIKALVEVSGKIMAPSESTSVIDTLPKSMKEKVYKIFIGSQDERRKFSAPLLWEAPSAIDHLNSLGKEEEQRDKVIDGIEEQLEKKFGKEALEEERQLNQQILKKSGYKGAIKLANDSLQHLTKDEL